MIATSENHFVKNECGTRTGTRTGTETQAVHQEVTESVIRQSGPMYPLTSEVTEPMQSNNLNFHTSTEQRPADPMQSSVPHTMASIVDQGNVALGTVAEVMSRAMLASRLPAVKVKVFHGDPL